MSNQFSESSVRSFPAAVAGVKGKAVKFASGLIVAAADANDAIIGVLDVAHDAGQDANVRLRSGSGSAVGLAGGAITQGAKVTANADGELIATTTARDEVVGIALEAAADGDLFELMLTTGTHPETA